MSWVFYFVKITVVALIDSAKEENVYADHLT